jgi:hypothetical protein
MIEAGGQHNIRIICEPTSMMWFPLAVAAKKRGYAVYRVKSEKVSGLRKYYKKHTKTDHSFVFGGPLGIATIVIAL